MQSLLIHATRRTAFVGPVADFSDVNPSTTADRFIATISWGDGTTTTGVVEGACGNFNIAGTHIYATNGTYLIEVSVSIAGPVFASASTESRAIVTSRGIRRAHPRPRANHRAPTVRGPVRRLRPRH
jgi:hypothetical protein